MSKSRFPISIQELESSIARCRIAIAAKKKERDECDRLIREYEAIIEDEQRGLNVLRVADDAA
jgi:hypothetical protein